MDKKEKIFNEVKESKVIERLLDKSSREDDHQTVYGDLLDYMRDMYFDVLSPGECNDIIVRLLGDYVIHHLYRLQEVYVVIQESNVDGEVEYNATPCATLDAAKKLMNGIVFDIVNESKHYSGYCDSEVEEYFDIESSDMSYTIMDKTEDYYEGVRIIKKNIIVC